MRILVVDDNTDNIDMMLILLRSKDYDVLSANNGKEALEILHSENVTLIISDILMPVMDGFQLCRECKKDIELAKICFIFYTATYTDDKDEEFALSIGALRFIRKPQEPDVFLDIIKEITENLDKENIIPEKKEIEDEKEILKLYSERLVAKLEKKNLDLENEIASHKITLSKLQKNEKKYRNIFENIQDVYYETELNGSIIEISPSVKIISKGQYNREGLIGKSLSKLYFDDEDLDKITLTLKETGFIKDLEIRFRNKDGSFIWCSVSARISFDHETQVEKIYGSIHDITDRKQVEGKLKLTLAKYKTMFDCFPLGITISDEEGWIIESNSIAEKLLGLSQHDQIGRKIDSSEWAIVRPDGKPMSPDEYPSWLALKHNKTFGNVEMGIVKPDNTVIWINVTAAPLPNEGNGVVIIYNDITESKQSKDKFYSLASRQEAILSAVPDIIMEVNNDKVYVWANKAGIDFFGEDVIGKEASFYFEGEQDTYKTVQPIFNGDENVIYIESWQRRSDGEKRLLAWWCRMLKDKDGKVTGSLSSARDITDRLQAEETIIKERALLRTLIDNLPNGVFVKDKEYRKIIVNPIHINEVNSHLKYLGIKSDLELLKKTDFEVFPENLAQQFFTDDQKVIRDGASVINNEGIGYDIFGKPIWLLVSKIPLRNNNGEITGLVGITTDITERRNAEEALKYSEEKFRTIFNNASDGMLLYDLEVRKFIMCNLACSKMLGYSEAEFLNLGLSEINPLDELENIFQKLEKINIDEIEWRCDTMFKSKNGVVFTADLNTNIITVVGKKNALIVFRDITERLLFESELRSAKEKAEESDKMKTAFLHNITHEIRTPLNGIIGFSDILTNPNLSDEKRKHFSYIIRQNGNQLLSIINDIISIATIEAGQENPNEKETDINNLLRNINDQFMLKAENKGVSLTIASFLKSNEANIWVDEIKLLQILTNLVGNALKYTSTGYIKVTCRLEGSFIQLSVEDTGIGIPKEMHEKIFDRFYQVDLDDTNSYGGNGLGLSIVKSYVSILKGEIIVNSEPGKGSEFIVTIPYKPIKKVKFEKKSEVAENTQIGSVTILIVDDDINNCKLISEYLSNLNSNLIFAYSGLQAVEICKENPSISIILMDAKMPLMNGYFAARQIKEFKPQLPIIMQSAYVYQNDWEKSMSIYTDGFIEKPIIKEKLLTILHLTLEKANKL